jgi:hypothetical protein
MRVTDGVFEGLVRSNPCSAGAASWIDDVGDADALLAAIIGDQPAVVPPEHHGTLRHLAPRIAGFVGAAAVVAAVVALVVALMAQPGSTPAGKRDGGLLHHATRLTAWSVAGDVRPPGWRVQGGTAYGTAMDLSCGSPTFCIWGGFGRGSGRAEGVIMASHDGGRTWQQVYGPSASGALTVGFSTCPAPTTCMVITRSSAWGPGETTAHGFTPPVMTVTTDGGSTWRSFALPALATGLASLSCTTARDCVVAGGQGSRPFAAFTTNGGRTWVSGTLPPSFTPTQVDCPSAQRCVAWGVAAPGSPRTRVPAYTSDGGRTWELAALPAGLEPRGGLVFSCPDTLHCLAITSAPSKMARGVSATAVSGVLVSADGGTSWSSAVGLGLTTPQGPPDLTVLRVVCTTSTDCWASGSTNLTSGATSSAYRAVVMQTIDGGRRWKADALPPTLEPGDTVGQLACPTSAGCVAGVHPVAGGPDTGELVLTTTAPPGGETG